jgi:adenylate cyclase
MTRSLSVDKLATIVQIFTQEMSVAVSKFNGQVLKYAGDAVIAYFPVNEDYSSLCNTSATCAFYMINSLEHSIIQYALGENSYADILGYGVSMAAKLTKLANPNQIIITHAIYIGLSTQLKTKFSELELVPSLWKYIDKNVQPGIWKSTSIMFNAE